MPPKPHSVEELQGSEGARARVSPITPGEVNLDKSCHLDQMVDVQGQIAHMRFLELLRNLRLGAQTETALASSVAEALRCKDECYRLRAHKLAEIVSTQLRESAKLLRSAGEAWEATRGKGPRQKHERVQKRHEAMDKAIANGITDPEALFRFLREHHPELVRKGKRDFIGPQQMMRAYRDARRPRAA